MSQTDNTMQTQFELSNSALLAKQMVTHFLQVCVDDDVQPLVTLAMASLGDLLLVSRQRIEEAQGLFRPSPAQGKTIWPSRKFIKKLGVVVGVSLNGWPEAFTESISLTKTFLLATACKVCFTDEEVGLILYEMASFGKTTSKVWFYPDQAVQFMSAVSGYSDPLLPFEHYSNIVNNVRRQLSFPTEMPMLFERCPPAQLGQILVNVFDALQDDEITRVTLEGALNGYWIAATLSWLLPEVTECSLRGQLLFGKSGARLAIQLIDKPEWYIGQWKLEGKMESVIIRNEDAISSIDFSPTAHIPFETAKGEIAAQFGLMTEAYVEATGVLASALVNVAYEKGVLYSSKCKSSEQLKALCSNNFTTSHSNAMHRYGWPIESITEFRPNGFTQQRDTVAEAISDWIEPRNTRRRSAIAREHTYIQKTLCDIFQCNIAYYDRLSRPFLLEKVDDCEKIIEPAIYLAGDALLTCFTDGSNPARVFRPCDKASLERYANILHHVIFQLSLPLATGTTGVVGYPFSALWLEALKASLPGHQEVLPGELAISKNGYVAYAKILEGFTTDKRAVSAINTAPGALRRPHSGRGERSLVRKLIEVISTSSLCGRELHVNQETIKPLSSENLYVGVEPRNDPHSVEVKHLVDRNGIERIFRFNTMLQTPSKQQSATRHGLIVPTKLSPIEPIGAPVSWVDSIEAIAFAEHVCRKSGPLIRPAVEQDVAHNWRDHGVFETIVWHETGKSASQLKNSISMTASDEELRFFEAGHLGQSGKLIIRHEAPLISCLTRAMDYSRWTILA